MLNGSLLARRELLQFGLVCLHVGLMSVAQRRPFHKTASNILSTTCILQSLAKQYYYPAPQTRRGNQLACDRSTIYLVPFRTFKHSGLKMPKQHLLEEKTDLQSWTLIAGSSYKEELLAEGRLGLDIKHIVQPHLV